MEIDINRLIENSIQNLKDELKTLVDENGKVITKLPQTGSVVPAIIAGVAILVVASLVVFKATRK